MANSASPEHAYDSLFAGINKAGDGRMTGAEYLDWALRREGKEANKTVWEKYFDKYARVEEAT